MRSAGGRGDSGAWHEGGSGPRPVLSALAGSARTGRLLVLSHLHAGSPGVGPASVLSEGAPPPQEALHRGSLRLEKMPWAPARTLAPGPPILISLHPQGRRFIYAGSNSGVVQAPVAFCGKHGTCEDCVLARDPYCAWSPATAACVGLHQTESPGRYRRGGRMQVLRPPSRGSPRPLCLVLQGSDPGHERGGVRLPR